MRAALRRWWQERVAREQRVLAAGAVLVCALLAWALVWHPLTRAEQDLRARLEARQTDLAFLEQAGGRLGALQQRARSGGARREGRSLLALVDASAREAGLGPVIRRLEPLDEKRIRIECKTADFDTLIGWLADLDASWGVRIEDLSVDRAGGPGQVDARLLLGES